MPELAYFSDLTLVNANSDPDCQATVDYRFPDFCALNFLEDGCLHFAHDDAPAVRLEAPAMYWTWPGPHWRYWRLGDAPWNHHWVSFAGPRTARYVAGGLLPALPCPAVRLASAEPILTDFQQVVRLVQRRDPRDQAAGVLLLERLLTTAQQARAREPRGDGLDDRLEALAEQIRAEPFRDWHFPHVARELELSYSHFRACFRACIQASPAAYLQRCRMVHIARALEHGESIKAVAYEHGYRDLGNFSRLFQRIIGLSPRAYLASTRLTQA